MQDRSTVNYTNWKGVINIFNELEKKGKKSEKMSFKKRSNTPKNKKKHPIFKSFIAKDAEEKKDSELSKSFRKTNSSNTYSDKSEVKSKKKVNIKMKPGLIGHFKDKDKSRQYFDNKSTKGRDRLSKSSVRVFHFKKPENYPETPKQINKSFRKDMRNNRLNKSSDLSSSLSPMRRSITFGKKREKSISDRLNDYGKLYKKRRKTREKEMYGKFFKPDIRVSQDSFQISKKKFDLIKKIDEEIERKNSQKDGIRAEIKIKPMAKLREIGQNPTRKGSIKSKKNQKVPVIKKRGSFFVGKIKQQDDKRRSSHMNNIWK